MARKGKKLIKLANDAPAPSATKSAGIAQQTNVEVDKNNEIKLVELFFISIR